MITGIGEILFDSYEFWRITSGEFITHSQKRMQLENDFTKYWHKLKSSVKNKHNNIYIIPDK